MRIAIIGAGFTGLSAGLRLAQKEHSVHIFEKENSVGGLAGGFKDTTWEWALEKTYHHLFTNDKEIFSLAKELNHHILINRPNTDILVENKVLPFDDAFSLLSFPYLSLVCRFRVGLVIIFLKLINNYRGLEDKLALSWLEKWTGKEATKLIWGPLFSGKFGNFKNSITLSWFWARIKKRTTYLAYPEGGLVKFAEQIASEIKKKGGKIYLNSKVEYVNSSERSCILGISDKKLKFDKIICTSPSPIFTKMAPSLPQDYIKQINSIPHLSTLNLVLVSKKRFLQNTYWLNITEEKHPFLVLVEHTNFMNPLKYNNEHVIYIGKYLPSNHPYLKMSKVQLLKTFMPYLLKINPNLKNNLLRSYKFISPLAQPIVQLGHSKLIPCFKTPLKNIYLANIDMVYPWDRGTNYAVALGEKIAGLID